MCALCDDGQSRDEVMGEVVEKVHAYGFTVIGVENGPHPFVYTVGLTGHGWPELVLAADRLDFVGDPDTLPLTMLGEWTNTLCRHLIADRIAPRPNMVLTLYGSAVEFVDLVESTVADYAVPGIAQMLYGQRVRALLCRPVGPAR